MNPELKLAVTCNDAAAIRAMHENRPFTFEGVLAYPAGVHRMRLLEIIAQASPDSPAAIHIKIVAFATQGRLADLQWLHERYHLQKNTIAVNNHMAVKMAGRSGHLETVAWMVTTYNITADELAGMGAVAAANGHHAVVNWLNNTLGSP